MSMDETSRLTQKTAVRFAKTGPAVYHSHHDMIRFWERAVKRADLPVRLTQGFNPRPRLVFPHALGLGIASECEEVEIELHARVDLPDLVGRLERAVAGAVGIAGARNLPPVKKSRQLVASAYLITGWPDAAFAQLPAAVDGILAETSLEMERGTGRDTRRVDIRPFLARLYVDMPARALGLELRHTQSGSGRPDEVAKLASARAGCDWRDLVIVKTGMTLDEG